MLEYFRLLLIFQVSSFLLMHVITLYLQGAAWRRHGNRSFELLVAGTVCGIFSVSAGGLPLFFPPTEALLSWSYGLGILFSMGQGLIGIRGAALLFRDYRDLAERAEARNSVKEAATYRG